MGAITGELLRSAAARLEQDADFPRRARALTATVTWKDECGCAYLSFYRGRIMEAGEGPCVYGSDFYITADSKNWDKAFRDPRFAIYELDGDLITLEGDAFQFAGNALAFRSIWMAVKEAYQEKNRQEGTHGG